jgi:hypothetical protein
MCPKPHGNKGTIGVNCCCLCEGKSVRCCIGARGSLQCPSGLAGSCAVPSQDGNDHFTIVMDPCLELVKVRFYSKMGLVLLLLPLLSPVLPFTALIREF